MKKHITVFLLSIFSIVSPVCGQGIFFSSGPWHLLEQGKIAYEKREFGEAIRLFEKARRVHKSQVLQYYNYLFSALKSYEVRAAGDLIANVYETLKKRQDDDACAILDKIFLTRPPEFFDKSIKNLMEWLKKSEAYPECDYLIGKVYELQGEYRQAFTLYYAAWDARDFLYIPDNRFEIIYSLSHVCSLLGQTDNKEKYLLLTLRAYIELTQLYITAGEYDRAYRTALLGANIAVTYLSDVTQKIDFTYVYTDFSDLLERVGRDTNILKVAEAKKIWRIFLQFAYILHKKDLNMQAADLYGKLAEHCPIAAYAREAEFWVSKIQQQ